MVNAAVGLEQLAEWSCLGPAALSFARQSIPRLLRPGANAVPDNSAGLTRFGDFLERVLSASSVRDSVDTLVLNWRIGADLYHGTSS